MKATRNVSASILARAGDGIVRDLRRIYGSAEEAERAVNEAMGDPEAIEEWATIVQHQRQFSEHGGPNFYFVPNVDLRTGELFSVRDLPGSLRDAALWSLAAAMLVWKAKEEAA